MLEYLSPENQNHVQDVEDLNITAQTVQGTHAQGINVTYGQDILGNSATLGLDTLRVTHGLDILGISATPGQDILGISATPGQDILGISATPGQDILGINATHGQDILGISATHGRDMSVTWDVFRSMYGGHSFITTKTTSRTTQPESAGQLCLPFSAPGELTICLTCSV